MIYLQSRRISTIADARAMLQTAIGVEFGTLPPYLYAMFSIRPGSNSEAAARIRAVALQEMIHMCLACNMLNALGGDPVLTPFVYPGPLPGDIGRPGGKPLTIRLLRFSKEAMAQAMEIERPAEPIDIPVVLTLDAAAPAAVTIGQFYDALDAFLKTLPPDAWIRGRNQIDDSQFFAGQLFAINGYDDAHRAITDIVSEGEGASDDPLDFQGEVAHYYRFGECFHDRVLTKADNPQGYTYGPATLGVDWSAVYPAIPDPAEHDFSKDPPAAQAAQAACNEAFSRMVDALRLAVTGDAGQLGHAVRAMFDLSRTAQLALTTPLADPATVAGPAFTYSSTKGASS
jgi:hypothetical protein